jgi:hypothetical protein
VADDSNSRSFYRLRYPVPERPKLLVGGETYIVTELSEGGMRIEAKAIEKAIDGTLLLKDGTKLKVKGIFGRTVEREMVIVELTGVSFGVLMNEQRRLLKRYLTV